MNDRKIIFHIDMDAYFVSVETADDPSLKDKPLVVTSSKDSGVVTSASYEARRYGICSGMPLFKAKQLYKKIEVIVGDSGKYIQATKRWYSYLQQYSDKIELYSIDEVFMDMTGSLHLFSDEPALARTIRVDIREKFNLPCSIGIAKNRLLSKIANGLAKPNGIFQISDDNMDDILTKSRLEDFPGIGKKLADRLYAHNINDTRSLRSASINFLEKLFGKKEAEKLYNISRGIDDSKVQNKPAKSIGKSTTIYPPTKDFGYISAIIMKLSYQVAQRLKDKGLKCTTVTVYIRFQHHHKSSQQMIENPTDEAGRIYKNAVLLLRKITAPISSIGISVSKLTKTAAGLIFEEDKKEQIIDDQIYLINKRFGEFKILPAKLMSITDKCTQKPHGFISKIMK